MPLCYWPPRGSRCPVRSTPMSQPIHTPPTQDEIDTARRLGVSLETYRRFKQNAGPEVAKLEQGEGPADVTAEERQYDRMRAEPGLFKSRDESPNIFVAAVRTPGEVAKTLLTILCYLVLMALSIVAVGSERLNRIPGVFEVIYLGVLLIPAMMLSSFLWRVIGEGARDVVRTLVRFWPLTFLGLVFIVGVLKVLLHGLPATTS
jgi:hypothetical protein